MARLDGLRVEVARTVRDRELYGRRGVRNLAGWLRADPRLADDTWKICRLAAMAPHLPKIAGLPAEGTVSLSQAGTACWQIARLPDLRRKPDITNDPAETDGGADGADGRDRGQPGEDGDGADNRARGQPGEDGDGADNRDRGQDGDGADNRDRGQAGEDGDGADAERDGEDAWAGLWRAGDVHAAV